MKQIWFSVCLLTGSLLYSSIAPAQPTASGALLQQMSSASRSLNYELAYISISKQGIESLRYRHAVIGNVPLGQLLHMDGPRREVLQRGGGISYFEPGRSRSRSPAITSSMRCRRSSMPISPVGPSTTTSSPWAAPASPIGRVKCCAWWRATVPATATSSGWTRTPSCRCGWICSIATAKRWSNIG